MKALCMMNLNNYVIIVLIQVSTDISVFGNERSGLSSSEGCKILYILPMWSVYAINTSEQVHLSVVILYVAKAFY